MRGTIVWEQMSALLQWLERPLTGLCTLSASAIMQGNTEYLVLDDKKGRPVYLHLLFSTPPSTTPGQAPTISHQVIEKKPLSPPEGSPVLSPRYRKLFKSLKLVTPHLCLKPFRGFPGLIK